MAGGGFRSSSWKRWPPLAAGSDGWFRVVLCCLGTLRLCCGTWPSSVCFAATFPPGEGFFGGTTLTEPSPRGKVGRAKPGSDEGHVAQGIGHVPTQPRPPRNHPSNHPVPPGTTGLPSPENVQTTHTRPPTFSTFPKQNTGGRGNAFLGYHPHAKRNVPSARWQSRHGPAARTAWANTGSLGNRAAACSLLCQPLGGWFIPCGRSKA